MHLGVGIAEFLANPMRYLVATNDVGATFKMLGRGFGSSCEVLKSQWFVFAFADENPRVGACKLVAARFCPEAVWRPLPLFG